MPIHKKPSLSISIHFTILFDNPSAVVSDLKLYRLSADKTTDAAKQAMNNRNRRIMLIVVLIGLQKYKLLFIFAHFRNIFSYLFLKNGVTLQPKPQNV